MTKSFRRERTAFFTCGTLAALLPEEIPCRSWMTMMQATSLRRKRSLKLELQCLGSRIKSQEAVLRA